MFAGTRLLLDNLDSQGRLRRRFGAVFRCVPIQIQGLELPADGTQIPNVQRLALETQGDQLPTVRRETTWPETSLLRRIEPHVFAARHGIDQSNHAWLALKCQYSAVARKGETFRTFRITKI